MLTYGVWLKLCDLSFIEISNNFLARKLAFVWFRLLARLALTGPSPLYFIQPSLQTQYPGKTVSQCSALQAVVLFCVLWTGSGSSDRCDPFETGTDKWCIQSSELLQSPHSEVSGKSLRMHLALEIISVQ